MCFRLTRLTLDDRGISSVEYALLLALVVGGIILAASQLGTAVEGEMNGTANCIETPDANTCN